MLSPRRSLVRERSTVLVLDRTGRDPWAGRTLDVVAVAVVYSFPKAAIATYDRHLALAHERLTEQPARRSHVCFEADDSYTVVDVWESAEDFEAFGDVLAQVAHDNPPGEGEPKLAALQIRIHRLHNAIP